MTHPTYRADLVVLGLIATGLIVILLSIIAGLFLANGSAALPNWAENVLITIATAAGLKLGDALSALVALATGREIGTLGQQLAGSTPYSTIPQEVEVVNTPGDPVPTTTELPHPDFGDET